MNLLSWPHDTYAAKCHHYTWRSRGRAVALPEHPLTARLLDRVRYRRCVTTTSSQPRRTLTDAGGVVISLLTPSVVVMRSTASASGYFRPCVVTPPALSDSGIRETRSPRRPEMGVCVSAKKGSTRPRS